MSHGEPCFFVRDKRPLCYYHDNRTGDGRVSLWCPVPPGVQEEMVGAEPVRFFSPPSSASGVFAGWLGVYLDTSGTHKVDWGEVAAIIEEIAFDDLDAPVERVSGAEVPAPYARNLETAAFPSEQQIISAVRRALYREG